ncbi:MAG: PRC-barrel domain-containing protein [Nanobdellota archaeon]
MMESKTSFITSDDILGKDVIDKDGQVLGVAQQLRINKQSKKILGIVIDQGFMKADLFIGLDYISNFGVDSVFLNTTPKPKLKGFKVYDRYGFLVGRVLKIEEKDNSLCSIYVRKHFLGKCYQIGKDQIMTIGYSVILQNGFKDIKKKEVNSSFLRPLNI